MTNPGLSPAVQEAFKRREQGSASPALNQTSPQASMANPLPQPNAMSDLNQASSPPDTKPVQAPKFQPQDRKDLITLALIEQLKNDNKLDKEKATITAQPAPQAPTPQAPAMTQSPAMPPQGGGGFSLSSGFDQPLSVNQMQSNYANGLGKDYSGLNNYGK